MKNAVLIVCDIANKPYHKRRVIEEKVTGEFKSSEIHLAVLARTLRYKENNFAKTAVIYTISLILNCISKMKRYPPLKGSE